jgi:hypothetical protein
MRGLLFLMLSLVFACAGEMEVSEKLDISKVPSEFPVGFCLLTTPERQYVAYYDAGRNMVVASRKLDAAAWVYKVLPTKIVWDSHNYVTMALDSAGQLHVSGNMHKVPLIYFCTQKPGDITTLKPAEMTGKLESEVTYPRFFRDKENRLIFSYRDGGSGNGSNFYNRYDVEKQTWSRLFDTPLFDGQKQRNAYPSEPFLGPDGMFHVHWVWRDTSDCSTNHHLSYMRSPDLIHWESVSGKKVKLPIKLDEKALYVDPIPVGGGIINGGHKFIFDSANTPVIVYHKSDPKGNMQIYAARPEKGVWKPQVLTKWEHPVKFSGGGSMSFIGIRLSGAAVVAPDVVSVNYRHKDYGSGSFQFNTKTLQLVDVPISKPSGVPRQLGKVESAFPGMSIKRVNDLGFSGEKEVKYFLQWETLEANRDKPRQPPLPEPSQLRIYKITEK